MSYREIDLNLTKEQIAMRDTARKFGAEVMRPAGAELDKLDDPADVVGDESVLWDYLQKPANWACTRCVSQRPWAA